MTGLADLSARELAAAIRTKAISPVDAVEAALSRIEARSALNAFVTVCAERARAEARQAEATVMAEEPLGPLHGVPFSVKDLTLTAGLRTTMGSALHADFVPKEDAVAVARARAAGAILIGKTTTPEFGHKPLTEAPIFGRTLNPLDPQRTCGGSSGGAAVAVAAGMGPIALGTDGGGSIRIPAACCGVVGLKPTLGAVPNLQAPDLFAANSYVGPMARDVADTALLFETIAGPHPGDPYGQADPRPARRAATLAGLRIAWLPRCGNILDPEVERVTTAAIRAAEALGAVVEPVELDFVALEPAFLVILESALAARLGSQVERHRGRLDPSLVTAVEKGLAHGAAALQQAAFARTDCFRAVQAVLERHDVIVSPTLSAPPLPVDQDPHGRVTIAGRDAGTIRGAWYPYTFPFNLTGHPALSLPCGRDAGGLPVGLQIVGRWRDDRLLLDIAALFEAR
ncbi:amidase family protein [Chelatococcus sp. SYSU_G07232]|uniref:Indoleacetamide hydrolase n=1 Tax=Chelatococcus albus TaxID=3047466 RepID=A0ABT7AJQ0_9HYPH|nr:amidase family protein [Chelatococcus sp. SYSU_G07232]MDJ1159589.1 amidase family protein [Chelatococcus sp. SYSU_G07232]